MRHFDCSFSERASVPLFFLVLRDVIHIFTHLLCPVRFQNRFFESLTKPNNAPKCSKMLENLMNFCFFFFLTYFNCFSLLFTAFRTVITHFAAVNTVKIAKNAKTIIFQRDFSDIWLVIADKQANLTFSHAYFYIYCL